MSRTYYPSEVLDALNEELHYIENLPRRTADNGVAGQLVTLRELVRQAERAWYSEAGDEAALDIIRKIAGTACRALIKYGCPRRQVPLKVYQPIKDELTDTFGKPLVNYDDERLANFRLNEGRVD